MTLASYNNFHNNMFKDVFVVTLTNAGRSTATLTELFKERLNNLYVYLMNLFCCFPLLLGTSVFAGFAIFSILGHMAYIYKMPIGKVVKEGQTDTPCGHKLIKVWKTSLMSCLFVFL